MIKAYELVWQDLCVEQSSVSYQNFFGYSYWAHKVFWHFESHIAGENIGAFKTLEEAKAACQAHFQQIVEGMVDMGHLKNVIRAAIAQGLACQPCAQPIKADPYKMPYIETTNYRALYEKEKGKWEKLKEFISGSDDYGLPVKDGTIENLIHAKALIDKMQELEGS